MSHHAERSEAVRSALERIRNIESEHGVTRQALSQIQSQLQLLAQREGWFTEKEFPAPPKSSEDSSLVYRLSQDAQTNRFALYVQSATAPTDTPPHNHDTWAVICGIRGKELNRFYARTAEGVEQTGSHVVERGTGVELMPDDLHSIHIDDTQAVINFHMYGRGLEFLIEREYYDRVTGKWKRFASRDNIIDAGYVLQ